MSTMSENHVVERDALFAIRVIKAMLLDQSKIEAFTFIVNLFRGIHLTTLLCPLMYSCPTIYLYPFNFLH